MASPIWEQIWELFDPNADPIDALISSGSYRAFVYFSSQNANAWKSASNADYTVPGGKTLLVLQWFTNRSVPLDFSARKVRFRNVTDSADVLADTDFRDATPNLPWAGDGGTASQLPTIATGKHVRLEIWDSDSTKRASGGIVICREV